MKQISLAHPCCYIDDWLGRATASNGCLPWTKHKLVVRHFADLATSLGKQYKRSLPFICWTTLRSTRSRHCPDHPNTIFAYETVEEYSQSVGACTRTSSPRTCAASCKSSLVVAPSPRWEASCRVSTSLRSVGVWLVSNPTRLLMKITENNDDGSVGTLQGNE